MKKATWIGMKTAFLAAGMSTAAPIVLEFRNDVPGTFIDISGTGTRLALGDDDEVVLTMTVGNDVMLPGRIVIGNNGGIGFGGFLPSDDLSPTAGTLPNSGVFNGGKGLLPGHDNPGTPSATGGVFYQEFADRAVIMYKDMPVGNQGETVTFEAQIFDRPLHLGPPPDDCIPFAQFFYTDFEGTFAQTVGNFTIGFQDGPGDRLVPIWNTAVWDTAVDGVPRNGDVLSLCPSPGSVGAMGVGLMVVMRRRR